MSNAAAFPENSRLELRREPWLFVYAAVHLPILVFGAWMFHALTSYRLGGETGLLGPVVESGVVCTTYEGELARNGVRFAFSARDPAVVAELRALAGEEVEIAYEERDSVPTTCFGDTEYLVTDVRKIAR
jgi:hypothetical protein